MVRSDPGGGKHAHHGSLPRLGIGALTFAFLDPAEASRWVKEYYEVITSEACVPIGHSVNANIAMVSGFSCHPDADEARRRGLDGFRFFGYALGHHYIFGEHVPGRTDIWAQYEKARDLLPVWPGSGGIGAPDQIAAQLRKFEQAGLDQIIFLQQGGRNKHEHICESLQLFASAIIPEFKTRKLHQSARKQARLAPFIRCALARKQVPRPLADDEIPTIVALGKQTTWPRALDGRTAAWHPDC